MSKIMIEVKFSAPFGSWEDGEVEYATLEEALMRTVDSKDPQHDPPYYFIPDGIYIEANMFFNQWYEIPGVCQATEDAIHKWLKEEENSRLRVKIALKGKKRHAVMYRLLDERVVGKRGLEIFDI